MKTQQSVWINFHVWIRYLKTEDPIKEEVEGKRKRKIGGRLLSRISKKHFNVYCKCLFQAESGIERKFIKNSGERTDSTHEFPYSTK